MAEKSNNEKKSVALGIDLDPGASETFELQERTVYVLRRGIFNIAFLKKVKRSDLNKIN